MFYLFEDSLHTKMLADGYLEEINSHKMLLGKPLRHPLQFASVSRSCPIEGPCLRDSSAERNKIKYDYSAFKSKSNFLINLIKPLG